MNHRLLIILVHLVSMDMIINKPKKLISNAIYQSQCVYGSKWFISTSNNIITYKLRINSQHGMIGIGFITNDIMRDECFQEMDPNDGVYYAITSNAAGYTGNKITNRPCGDEDKRQKIQWGFGTDDILYITLNLSTSKIKFESTRKDDKGTEIRNNVPFNNIEIGDNIAYKLVISGFYHGDSVTILDCKQDRQYDITYF